MIILGENTIDAIKLYIYNELANNLKFKELEIIEVGELSKILYQINEHIGCDGDYTIDEFKGRIRLKYDRLMESNNLNNNFNINSDLTLVIKNLNFSKKKDDIFNIEAKDWKLINGKIYCPIMQ